MKLFEALVTEGQLRAQASKLRTETRTTFDKKRHLMEKKVVTFHPVDEGKAPVVESQSDINTTVSRELRWLSKEISKSIDTGFQIAHGNTVAKADVVLDDGTVLLKDVPATGLLDLDKRLGEFRDLVDAAPTLDPAKGFRLSPDDGPGIYAARPSSSIRTRKVPKVIVKFQPTKEHEGQADLVTVDEPAGRVETLEWSGLWTPATKSTVLSRIESLQRAVKTALQRAVKTALQRANTVTLQSPLPTCASILFEHIFGSEVQE